MEKVAGCPGCGEPEGSSAARVKAQMHPGPEAFSFVRCHGCGLVYLDPRVPEERVGGYYTEAYLPHRGPGAWGVFGPLVEVGLRRMDRSRVRTVMRHAEVGPKVSVLDVGCGSPTFLAALARATACRAIGTDRSDAGWRDDPERWEGLILIEGDIHEVTLPAPPEVVTMWHYLEHDYRPLETLVRIRELIQAGYPSGTGTLIVEVPDYDSWTRRRHGVSWAGYHAPRHVSLFTESTLRGLLERSGWKVIDLSRRGTLDPYILHWMSRMERRGTDWSGGFGRHFPGFAFGKLLWSLRFGWRNSGLGVMTAVARVGSPT